MKPIYLTIFCILILASCRQETLEYSCDPVLNDYVSTNKEKLSQITITDLSSSDLAFQQAVFRSFDAVKKRTVWLNKIQILLETQEYTEMELAHLIKLRDYMSEGFFVKENIDSQVKNRTEFASNWITYAKKKLGWSDKNLAFVVYRLYTSKFQFEAELNVLKSAQIQTSVNSESCNCNTSSDYCFGSCNSGNCETSSGCGFLWSQTCDGTCY